MYSALHNPCVFCKNVQLISSSSPPHSSLNGSKQNPFFSTYRNPNLEKYFSCLSSRTNDSFFKSSFPSPHFSPFSKKSKFECSSGNAEDVSDDENESTSTDSSEKPFLSEGINVSVNKFSSSDSECVENEEFKNIGMNNNNINDESVENDDSTSDKIESKKYDMSVLKERLRAMEENEIRNDRLSAKNWKEGRCEHRVVAVLNDWVRKLKFHGDVLAIGTYKGVVYTYDLGSGKQLSKLKGHRSEITCLDFDGARLVAGSDATTFLLWDTTGSDSPTISFQGHTQSITSLKLDGQIVLSSSRDCSFRIWQASTGECVHVAQSGSPIFCMDSDDDIVLLGLSNGMIASYSISSYKLEKTFQAHQHSVTCIQYNAKLDYVITGSSRGSIRLWKYSSGEFIRSFQAHQGEIASIQFDSVKIVSAARDGTVNVWDLSTGKCLYSILGHTAYIGSAQFDQTKLISDGFNNVVVCHDFVF